MLKLFFSSFVALFFTACLTTSSILLPPTKTPDVLNTSSILKIAIPVREHGYSNFDTQILNSQHALDTFVNKIKKQKSWNKRENFISSLTLFPVDFRKYNILLYRMTESSGSTVLAIDAPKGNDKHVLIKIGRDKPNTGTDDMAYYALAYKVAKHVQDITFDNDVKKHVIKNKALNIEKKSEVPKECLEWYDGCNNCGRVGTADDAVCTERACYQKGEFKCTKWKAKTLKMKSEKATLPTSIQKSEN